MEIAPSPNAAFRSLDEGGVILNVETGAYFELNRSGRFIWEQIQRQPSVDDLANALSSEFSIDNRSAHEDLTAFLGQLRERGLLA